MLIGIDGNEANMPMRVGIGEYSFEILKHFKSFNHKNIDFLIYLKKKPVADLPPQSTNFRYEIVGPDRLWTQFGLPLALYFGKPKPDLFFSPSHYAPRFCPVPRAISVMDVSYLHYPELFAKKDLYQLKHWTAYSIKKASKVFTISKASKNDIINQYKISPQDVVVTYPGIKENKDIKLQMSNINLLREKYQISEKFILFVGTVQPRKNLSRLMEAFAWVVKKHQDIDLIIVGKKGWLYEPILKKPAELNITSKVKFLDFVSDTDLSTLYKNALSYVLPSLYEGFGLPVLEAMNNGCPVIISNVSSLPEAGGDAALYVDPLNVSDIKDKMLKLIENPNLRKEFIRKGYENLKRFSWEKTAKQTLDVLEEIAKNKNYER